MYIILNRTNPFTHYISRLLLWTAAFFCAASLSSCFTGVEGTKKIKLSREDRKALLPSDEEQFFVGITGSPVADWKIGKEFIAADDKTLLIFEQQGLPSDPSSPKIGGKILSFLGTDTRIGADGNMYVVIAFGNGNDTFLYNTGKTKQEADSLSSEQIPMMIDCDMVDKARSLLIGKNLWVKSPLWYDRDGNRIPGLKFVAVTIEDVQPGSVAFPLNVRFSTTDGKQAWLMMNFGNSGTESRSFPSLFSLSDIRKKYPAITDESWELICHGKVTTGMTKEECKLALGNPTEVNSGHDYSQTLDLWHYPNGAVLWFEDGLLSRFRQ